MKNLLIIILFFVTLLPMMGQEDSVNIEHKIQLSLEIKPVGGGLNFDMPINNKYVFTFGLQTGFILTYFLAQTKERENNFGYVELLGINIGVIYYSTKHWHNTISLKFGIPFIAEGANFTSPYGGISFQTFFKVSPTSSIGTNIDAGLIMIENHPVFNLATSIITYRITMGK